ncbi:MAG: HEAT repeat domain-containing protein [Gemmatimonadota bacterium]
MASPEVVPDRTRQTLLDGAIRELGFAVQAMELYPAGSPVVTEAIQRAHAGLFPLLRHGPVQLDVLPSSFRADGREIGEGNAVVGRLAGKLHHRRVARLDLDALLVPETLSGLAEALGQDRAELEARGGLDHYLQSRHLPGLSATLLQLEQAFQEDGRAVEGDQAWDTLLLGFQVAQERPDISWQTLAASPEKFRALLEWLVKGADMPEELSAHSRVDLLRLACQNAGQAAIGMGAAQLELILREIRDVYAGIHPEVWMELLAEPMTLEEGMGGFTEGDGDAGSRVPSPGTEGREERAGPVDLTKAIARGLERSQLEELIVYSVENRGRASSRVMQLFSRILEGREDRKEIAEAAMAALAGKKGGPDDSAGLLQHWPDLQDVLLGEDPGPFVSRRYQATLELLDTEGAGSEEFWPMERIRPRMREMDPTFLLRRKSEIFLSLLERESEVEEYLLLANELEKALPEFVVHQEYDLVERLIATFARHRKVEDGRPVRQRDVAEQVLDRFCNRHTLLQLVRSFLGKPARTVEAGARIFPHLGSLAIPPLFTALSQEKSRPGRLLLLQILSRMGPGVGPAIEAHLYDERWYVVRNLVSIVREIGDPQFVEHLRITIRHPDARVRRESAQALANIGGAAAGELLIAAVDDEDRETQVASIQGVGKSGLIRGVPRLRPILRLSNRRGNNSDLIEAAAVALGRLGDTESVGRLQELSRTPWLYAERRRSVALAARWALQSLGVRPRRGVARTLARWLPWSRSEEKDRPGVRDTPDSSGRAEPGTEAGAGL